MRIAQVAPLVESVPPQLYGGAERVVSYLTEELVDLGHRVTLFASGDSSTRAELVPGSAKALRLGGSADAANLAHRALLSEVQRRRADFDVIHFHLPGWHALQPSLLTTSHLFTAHEALEQPDAGTPLLDPALRLVAVSDAQRALLPSANWLGTVPHGLPDGLYRPRTTGGTYLTFLGRLSPATRVDRAVEIARRFGMPLKIAAKVDRADYPYYLTLRKQLRQPFVEFVGEVDQAQKSELLAGSFALLSPTDQQQPFGLAMIEAMASGTPVVAYRNGSVSELIDQGVTGFVVDSIEDAVRALSRVSQLDRRLVARVAYQRFGARRMARDYLRLYARSMARDATVHFLSAAPAERGGPAYAQAQSAE